MAVNAEGQSQGITRSQAFQDRVGDAVGVAIGVKEALLRKPKEVLGVLAVGAAFAVGGATEGHPERAVTAATGAIESVGGHVVEPVVSGAVDLLSSDPDPLANYTGDDADKNIIAGNSNKTEETAAPETTTSAPVYDGVHVEDGSAEDSGLPTSPEDKEFGQQLAEQNQQAQQRVAETYEQATGGATYEENTGGTEAQVRP